MRRTERIKLDMTPSPEKPLYYPAELDLSFLIGAAIECTTYNGKSYTLDTDSNMDICTDKEIDSIISINVPSNYRTSSQYLE